MITKADTSIVPHVNWRGQFAMGTYADGVNVGRVSDCGSFPAQNCVPIQWPGERTTVYHELTPDANIRNWFGSLVDGMRDATGQLYRRNRYYDPQTGQFTQTDPIGLAGGLNAYGFAEGDPVSYDDPYGLAVEEVADQCRTKLSCAIRGVRAAGAAYRTWRATRRARRAVDDLVDAARRSGRAAQRVERPTTPDGMGLPEFGNVMQWGRGSAAARTRIGTLTREDLEQAGVTREIAQEWRDFYVNEIVRNPSNPSARGRAELMQHALELLR